MPSPRSTPSSGRRRSSSGDRTLGDTVLGLFFTRVRVEGDSMRPTYLAGDRLLVARRGRLRPGDVVALTDPRDPTRTLVKRVVAIGDDRAVEVRGDNPAASTDSRTFGPVPRALVKGRVVRRY